MRNARSKATRNDQTTNPSNAMEAQTQKRTPKTSKTPKTFNNPPKPLK